VRTLAAWSQRWKTCDTNEKNPHVVSCFPDDRSKIDRVSNISNKLTESEASQMVVGMYRAY
jgi:hypothetical protein